MIWYGDGIYGCWIWDGISGIMLICTWIKTDLSVMFGLWSSIFDSISTSIHLFLLVPIQVTLSMAFRFPMAPSKYWGFTSEEQGYDFNLLWRLTKDEVIDWMIDGKETNGRHYDVRLRGIIKFQRPMTMFTIKLDTVIGQHSKLEFYQLKENNVLDIYPLLKKRDGYVMYGDYWVPCSHKRLKAQKAEIYSKPKFMDPMAYDDLNGPYKEMENQI